jgi:hypothetical protein
MFKLAGVRNQIGEPATMPSESTVHIAIELSVSSWLVAARLPGAEKSRLRRRKPSGEWLALKPGAHEGYLDWERAEAIRRMVSENIPTSRQVQPPPAISEYPPAGPSSQQLDYPPQCRLSLAAGLAVN